MNNRGLFVLVRQHVGIRVFYDRAVSGLSNEQHSLILGTLLGDGSMRCKKNALLEINHCTAQRKYVDWKYDVLRKLVGTPPKLRRTNGSREAYRFTTLSLPELTPYYRAFYGCAFKSVPQLELNPLALAVWFMDDGCKTRGAVYFNTQQFDQPSQERLMDMLRGQFQIHSTLNRDKSYFRIRVRVGSVSRLRQLIEPHLLPEMLYKLPA